MIYLDVTKSGVARHQSGLMRVNGRLGEEFGPHATAVRWDARKRMWLHAGSRGGVNFTPSDWLFTTELFSERERPGLWEFLRSRKCRLGALFSDAIPLRFPQITWPQSVARHPEYMKMLASFDRVWAVSEASRLDLTEFWRWQGVTLRSKVETILLGADLVRGPRMTLREEPPAAHVLCVGILEPRKNQLFLIDVCEALWADGLDFDLHVVGRVNPHFGRPIANRLKTLRKTQPRVHYHKAPPDLLLERLYTAARVTAFSTLAEGCGLPVLESLWKGRPCVCSDLPVLREIAGAGGCVLAAPNDLNAWAAALRMTLGDDAGWRRLASEAIARPLPVWADTARTLLAGMS